MSAAPAMPIFPDAYLADTTHLTTEEHGVYLLLLMAMWRRNGTVPNDDKDLARIVGLSLSKWLKAKARLSSFLMIENGEITQKRLKKEWNYCQERREKNAQNGAKGGRPVSNKNNDIAKANGSVSVNPNESPLTLTHNQLVKEEDKSSSKKRGSRLPDDFEPDMLFAVTNGLSRDQAQGELSKFRDYWIAQPGQKGVKVDWPATWRNWCRNVRNNPARSTSPPGSNRRRNFVDVARDRMNGNGSTSLFGSDGDAERIPTEQRRSGFDDDDLRGRTVQGFITSDR